ncbi:MAG: PEP-CTERM sorting domain-containing protein [Planctomycetes bacterium]|nr:PEP-CTERM sorting domain-containing protein [Planctomycetota bacterium]
MKKHMLSLTVAIATCGAAAASTIATFSDPSPDGTQPLFTFASAGGAGSLTGGWSGTGLLLETPGLAAPDFADARFTMPAVAAVGGLDVWALGPGLINFTDSGGNLLMTISFASGTLTSPTTFGASDFVGQNVVFGGPIIPPGLSDETFAFSFANPAGTLENYTVTAAFTSSAVPEPAAIALLAIGAVLAIRRR